LSLLYFFYLLSYFICYPLLFLCISRFSFADESGTSARGLGRKSSVSFKNLLSSNSTVSTGSKERASSASGVAQVTASGVEVVVSDPVLEEGMRSISFICSFCFVI
jgi:hypothetical protein